MKIAISPCPNDTFIFRSLIQGCTSWLPQEVVYADIETLNTMALAGDCDVIKVSASLVPLVQEDYFVLPCGGAMGYGCGPLCLSSCDPLQMEFKLPSPLYLPGEHTTAAALFKFWAHKQNWHGEVRYLPYDQIYTLLKAGTLLGGVVIHENRFTYRQDGLHLLSDLGAFWESQTGFPVPLGVLLVSKKLADSQIVTITQAIQQSLQAAWRDLPYDDPWIAQLAQIADVKVIRSHIELYVSNFSYKISDQDKQALEFLWKQSGLKMPTIWGL
jgi:1,4-dihydroxy-6-naphthoate synthase